MNMETIASAAIAPQPNQYGATETYSDNILGPVSFRLSNLQVAGSNVKPAAPAQSPYIIGSNEKYAISVDIEFNKTPLTALLMCLGTNVSVDFAFEGYGKAGDLDLVKAIKTQKGQYKYTVTYEGVPTKDGLVSGLYQIAAVATIGPVDNACSTCVFGHGYLEQVLLEVYPAGEECLDG